MPDGTCFRRASAGDMARSSGKIVDFREMSLTL
jgi:hypothetical protein